MESTAKQFLGFQRTAFDNGFSTLTVIQDQTETMMNNFMGQLPWATEENKKIFSETAAMAKKARDEFKKAIDDGYNKFEALFDQK